jgi:cephalosporin-C deacetylase
MPLCFDFPFEQLTAYLGKNPRPPNFEAYWERGLAEMRSLDPQLELVPADFQAPYAECFHMYFTGVGGARVHAKLLRPKDAHQPHPAVLMFHGYASDSGDFADKLSYVGQGYTVAALDCRGQGGLSEDPGGVTGNTKNGHIIRGLDNALKGDPDKLLFRQIFLDTAQLAKIVMEMPDVDPGRVGATGGSQGGALTVACAGLEPRLKRIAPVYPFLSDYKRVWEMDQAKNAYLRFSPSWDILIFNIWLPAFIVRCCGQSGSWMKFVHLPANSPPTTRSLRRKKWSFIQILGMKVCQG